MSSGLYSGTSGIALGSGLYRSVSGLWGGASGLVAGFGSWTPAALFAASEPGFWYDPSDLSTLFQDTAGTTPVTAAGQPVGLALDKRLGLVLGSELVTNGSFTGGSVTGWNRGFNSVDGTFTATDGVATYTKGAGDGAAPRMVAALSGLTVGTFYRITYRRDGGTGAGDKYAVWTSSSAGTGGTTLDIGGWSAGTSTVYLQATATTMYLAFGLGATSVTGTTISFSAVGVKELPGNHATQSTALSRPTLGRNPASGTRNLLTYTEDFSNAVWVKVSASIATDTATAPNGTTSADTLASTGADSHISLLGGTTAQMYTFSFYAKRSNSDWVACSNAGFFAYFNIQAGTVGTVGNGSASIQNVGDGWYRCSWVPTDTTQNTNFRIRNAVSNGNVNTTTQAVFIWGAQLETGSTATAYQKVVSAFDVTEAGKADCWYLGFDGSDDWMVTPTITPGTDKVQLFTGVRTIGGIPGQTICETSFASGAFGLFSNSDGTNTNTRWQSSGTLTSRCDAVVPSSPRTQVISGIADIAADICFVRSNAAQVQTSASDQGTGNYLAYPAYIGRRGGTSSTLNGRIYSLICRFGSNLDAATIAQTETWVNTKTAAIPVDYTYLQTAGGDQLVTAAGDTLYSIPIYG